MSNYVPEDAPFSAEQRAWLNRFFSQMYGKTSPSCDATLSCATQSAEAKSITILFGSQTGNCEALAAKLAKSLPEPTFITTISDLASFNRDTLASLETVIFLVSTYGDGEPPDNAQEFYDWLLSDQAPKLDKLNYAVLALGDSSYPDFCKCGIDIDSRLSALGAKAISPRVDCDVDFESAYTEWRNSLIPLLTPCVAATSAQKEEEPIIQPFGKSNPFPAKVLRKFNLTDKKTAKETIHIEMYLEGSGMTYEAGDALGMLPRNDSVLVDAILKALPFNVNENVKTDRFGEISLREALICAYDITSINKAFLTKWQQRCGHPRLRALVESGTKEDFEEFCSGRGILDLVTDFPADFRDAEDFVSILKKLAPRLYSIASSPNAHPGEVHLTVGVVRYEAHGIKRDGVCSTYMADRLLGHNPLVFIHHNKNFRLPEDGTKPIIMVGPGTGIAPFRAFLEERTVSHAKGQNWLFFGNQHAAKDFLYEAEIKKLEDHGLVRCTTAFSRDQEKKIYVQDRMREHAKELWSWLQNGAYFYVCGDASRMAKDVDIALHEIAMSEGKLSEEEAKAYFADLKKQRRYQRDVY